MSELNPEQVHEHIGQLSLTIFALNKDMRQLLQTVEIQKEEIAKLKGEKPKTNPATELSSKTGQTH